jgi:hypothetical protein
MLSVKPNTAGPGIKLACHLARLAVPELGESLVNDATALVAYRFAMTAIVTGSFSPVEAALRFVLIGR